MSLVNCLECNAKISENASNCPQCGCPGPSDYKLKEYLRVEREIRDNWKPTFALSLVSVYIIAALLGGIYCSVFKSLTFLQGCIIGALVGFMLGTFPVQIVIGIKMGKEIDKAKEELTRKWARQNQ